jgi:hypothetical protein
MMSGPRSVAELQRAILAQITLRTKFAGIQTRLQIVLVSFGQCWSSESGACAAPAHLPGLLDRLSKAVSIHTPKASR